MSERLIYELVKDRPWLKDWLKKAYQGVFSIMGRTAENLPDDCVIRENCFFGFHDKSPWSSDNKLLLAHQFEGVGNEPELAENAVSISIFSGQNWQKETKVAKTSAWNWQQGAQLQWLAGKKQLVFNDFHEGVCRAVNYDLEQNQTAYYDFPVVAISPNGKYFASICFETFGRAMPGYGYDFEGAKATSNIPTDALIVFDEDGEEITSLAGKGLPRASDQTDAEGISFISHVLFSKSGNKLAFMRRLALPGRRVRSALYVLDMASYSVTRMPFRDMVSHYCWLNDEEIFAYANDNQSDGYFLSNINSDDLTRYSDVLGQKDGHPHADADGSSIVFDAYPDRRRLQRLALFNIRAGQVIEVARLFSPLKFWSTKRVDLHPRLRADGEYICVDCSTSGVRSLATVKVQSE